MGRGRGESPSQILTRHLVGLFSLVLVGMHISLGFYYFEAQGSYYRHLVGFLTYVKQNVESPYISRIEVVFQDTITRAKGSSSSIFRWAGSSSGYYCDGVYQNNLCSTTTTVAYNIEATFARNFYYLPALVNALPKSANFVIEGCPAAGCTPLSATAPAKPTQFKIVLDPASNKNYIQINGSINLQDYKIYKLFLGISEPCLNESINSLLPSYLQFAQYATQGSCDRFGIVPNTIPVTQDTSTNAGNTGTISLNIKEVFQGNEMTIMLSDLGRTFASSTDATAVQNFNLYLLPKISYSSTITDTSSCVVDDDLSRVPSYSNYINQTGLTFFILKQIFIVFLIPIPILEMIMGFQKNPQVVMIGIVSKILIIVNMLLFILEGSIIRYEYFMKTNLVNKLRNYGWQTCFDNDAINQQFMKFPSVFSSSQDTFNYYDEVYMWIACVGLFILVLLYVKLGMDMCVKKKRYGEYDADANDRNANYEPAITYIPYQEQLGDQQQQQQYMSYSQQLLPQVSLVKSPSNRQKLMPPEKRNNLSTINESNTQEQPIKFSRRNQQVQEMQVLSNQNQKNSSEEEEEED